MSERDSRSANASEGTENQSMLFDDKAWDLIEDVQRARKHLDSSEIMVKVGRTNLEQFIRDRDDSIIEFQKAQEKLRAHLRERGFKT